MSGYPAKRALLVLLLLTICVGRAGGQGLSRSMDESHKALREAMNLDRLGKKARAKAAYRRAIRLNPRSLKAFDRYSLFLFAQGAFSEGVKVMRIGLKLNRDQTELWAFLGLHLYRLGQIERAHAAFKTAPRMARRYDVQVFRAQCAMLLEDYPAAVAALRDYLAHRPAKLARGDHAFHTQLGLALLRMGRLEQARRELDVALRARPGYRQARLTLAELHLRKRRCARAVPLLRALLLGAPNGSEAALHLGLARLCLGQHRQAQLLAEHYLREHAAMLRGPRRALDKQHRRNLTDALVLQGDALIRQGHPGQALAPLRAALELSNSEALTLRVARAHFQARDHRRALAVLKGLIRQPGASAQTLILALRAAVHAGQHAVSEYCASRLLAQPHPRAEDYYYAGVAYNSAGLFRRATATLQDALKRGVKHRGVLLELVRAYCHQARRSLRAGRPEEAARKLERAAKVVPDAPAVRRNLALVYLRLRRGALALAQAQRLVRLRPDGPVGWWLVGRALVVQGRHKEALQHYRLAAIKARNDGLLVARLQAEAGVAWLEAGMLERGVTRLTEAAELLASNRSQRALAEMLQRNITRARLQRGIEALDQGRPRKALALLASARAGQLSKPERSVIEAATALALAISGNARGARATLKELGAEATRAVRPAYAGVAQELLLAFVELQSRNPAQGLRAAATLERLASRVPPQDRSPLRTQAASTLTRLGAQRFRSGSYVEARTALTRAIQLIGVSPALRHNRALTDYYAGHPQRALQELVVLTRTLPLAFCNLAVHHDRRGAPRRAYQLYSKCLKAGGQSFPDLKQILEIKQQIFGLEGARPPTGGDPP